MKKLTNNIDDGNSIILDYNDYDKVGNRLSMKINDANAHVYTYDEIYRLTFVDYNDGNSTSYSYDALGCLRRVLWQDRIKSVSGKMFVHDKNFEFLIEALASAA